MREEPKTMKPRTLLSVPILLLLLFTTVIPARAQTADLRTVPFLSHWNDYKTVVPNSWTPSYDNEGAHFTETTLGPNDSSYRLVIRWYTNYSTHMPVDGQLEMYGSPDNFIQVLSGWYGKYLVESSHEVSVAGKRGQRIVGRMLPTTSTAFDLPRRTLGRRAKLGSSVDDAVARNGGKQAWTVVPARSGFYVLAYFAPEEDFAKYEEFYDQMIASFVLLKDGPDGSPIPGSSPPPVETPDELSARRQETLKRWLADLRELQGKASGIDVSGTWEFQGEKDVHLRFEVHGNQLVATMVSDNEALAQDTLRERPFFDATLDRHTFSGRMSYYKFEGSSVSGSIDENNQRIEWTVPERDKKDSATRQGQSLWPQSSIALRKKIVQLVSIMQSPPAIPEEAKRVFVEGNVFFRGAKSTADYNLAVNKYKEALTEAPWWGLAYNNLGIALRDAGRLDEAKTALELYLLTKPADAGTAQITLYEIGGQQQLAEEHKRQERDRQIQCGQEYQNGNASRALGPSGYNDAIQHYKKAAEMCSNPKTSAAMYAVLGEVYRLQGNLDEAYKYMQKAFELDPNPEGVSRWIYPNFGTVLDNRGDHAAACQCWRKGCNAGDPTSCSNLSRCP